MNRRRFVSALDRSRYVMVLKGQYTYMCPMVRGVYKCGQCLRGILGINPKIASECRVCHAVVVG